MKTIIVKLKMYLCLCSKFFYFCKSKGILTAIKRVYAFIMQKHELKKIIKSDLEKQTSTKIDNRLQISIIVPLFNTPQQYLIEMIESIQKQTYQNWQLCMADGSTESFGYVQEVCMKYANSDKRILYKKLDKNYGISENTNFCLSMAKGDYIGLLDHDDLLPANALAEVMMAAEKLRADFIYTDECIFETTPDKPVTIYYKPDFGMDTLRSYNYISHFVVFKRELLDRAGNFKTNFDCSQDYDIYFRLLEHSNKVVHIPKILYYWRSHSNSSATDITLKPDILDKAKLALQDHLNRSGIEGRVMDSPARGIYRVQYKIQGNPLVSIIVAKDSKYLQKCIESIKMKTTYNNYEIIEVNGLATSNTYNNGMKLTKGEYIVFLSGNTEVIENNWIEEMLMFAQRSDVGIVGGKLYYLDNTISHAGIVLGLFGAAGYGHRNFPADHTGYMCKMYAQQNITAVSGACMMIKRETFEKCNGFDESYKAAYFDIDFCLNAARQDYHVIFTPYAEMFHNTDKDRYALNDEADLDEEINDKARFTSIWWKEIVKGDKYYNPNLSLETDNYAFKTF